MKFAILSAFALILPALMLKAEKPQEPADTGGAPAIIPPELATIPPVIPGKLEMKPDRMAMHAEKMQAIAKIFADEGLDKETVKKVFDAKIERKFEKKAAEYQEILMMLGVKEDATKKIVEKLKALFRDMGHKKIQAAIPEGDDDDKEEMKKEDGDAPKEEPAKEEVAPEPEGEVKIPEADLRPTSVKE